MLDLSIVTPLYPEKKMFISHLNLYAYKPPKKKVVANKTDND